MSTTNKEVVLSNEDFTVKPRKNILGSGLCIYYKDKIPMWYSVSYDLTGFKFYILYEKDDDEECSYESTTIVCKDAQYGDLYTYGEWSNIEECRKWLENPEILY